MDFKLKESQNKKNIIDAMHRLNIPCIIDEKYVEGIVPSETHESSTQIGIEVIVYVLGSKLRFSTVLYYYDGYADKQYDLLYGNIMRDIQKELNEVKIQ